MEPEKYINVYKNSLIMKDKNFRNMVNDPYLYNNCCGGYKGADGSDESAAKVWGARAKALAVNVVVIVGVAVTATWLYKKFIK